LICRYLHGCQIGAAGVVHARGTCMMMCCAPAALNSGYEHDPTFILLYMFCQCGEVTVRFNMNVGALLNALL